jgi:hypothetical protein
VGSILLHLFNATNKEKRVLYVCPPRYKNSVNLFSTVQKNRGGGGTARLRIYVCTPHYTREVR